MIYGIDCATELIVTGHDGVFLGATGEVAYRAIRCGTTASKAKKRLERRRGYKKHVVPRVMRRMFVVMKTNFLDKSEFHFRWDVQVDKRKWAVKIHRTHVRKID